MVQYIRSALLLFDLSSPAGDLFLLNSSPGSAQFIQIQTDIFAPLRKSQIIPGWWWWLWPGI